MIGGISYLNDAFFSKITLKKNPRNKIQKSTLIKNLNNLLVLPFHPNKSSNSFWLACKEILKDIKKDIKKERQKREKKRERHSEKDKKNANRLQKSIKMI